MNLLPLVSIIIPNFNHAKYISSAIDSVISQTFKNWEVIIVDNHSTDKSDQIIEPYLCDNIRLLKIHNNGIIAASRNLGVLHSRGDWIAFLDADDWWMKNKLEACSKVIESANHDVIYHNVYLINKIDVILRWRRTWSRKLSEDALDDLINNGNPLVNSSVVVRKTALAAIGGITEDRNCISWEDYDTWLRLAERKYVFKKLAGVHGFYWNGGGNISNPQQEIKNVESFILKYLPDRRNSTVPWWCYYSNGLSYDALKEYKKSLSSFRLALRSKSILTNKLKTIIRLLEIFIKMNSIKFNS